MALMQSNPRVVVTGYEVASRLASGLQVRASVSPNIQLYAGTQFVIHVPSGYVAFSRIRVAKMRNGFGCKKPETVCEPRTGQCCDGRLTRCIFRECGNRYRQ